MAWRPNAHLLNGYLDNTVPGIVTGYLRFRGMKDTVRLNLVGDFHRDVRGAVLSIKTQNLESLLDEDRGMAGFSAVQDGDVGDITAGREPVDYVDYPYIEWYSKQNGRVVLELESNEVEVIGTPLIADEQQPIDRAKQFELMARFLSGIVEDL